MDFKLLLAGLGVAAALSIVPGCAAESLDEADAEEAAATEADLTSNAARLVGAFTYETGAARPPSFRGIVFENNGKFFADVDTGIRCVRAPCPSSVRLDGTFRATASYLTLSPKAGAAPSDFYGRYKYSLAIGRETGVQKITLSRAAWSGWSNTVQKQGSFCMAASDCEGQNLIVPACMGQFKCTELNTCSWHCGVLPSPDVWPSDASKLVAETAGGGFTPPVPPGSNCNYGQQKYTLTVQSRLLAWEKCEMSAGGTLQLQTGSRTLTAAQFSKIDAAANAVTLSRGEICGADKPMLTMTVSTPASTKKYTDSFYSCMGGTRNYVDNIDGVFGAMRAATP